MELKFADHQTEVSHPQVLQVIDDFWEPEEIAAAYRYFKPFRSIATSGDFWFDVDLIRRTPAGELAEALGLRSFFGAAADMLAMHFRKLFDILPAGTLESAVALELWFTIARDVNRSRKVYLHTDSNHTEDDWTNNVRLPMWGTVLHLGPPSGLVGGETLFCTETPIPAQIMAQLHESVCHDHARSLSREWIEINQKQNRLVIFRGNLPHYAAPVQELASPDEPRMALLVNVWDHLPIAPAKLHGCSTMLPAEHQAIMKLTETQLEQLKDIVKLLEPEELNEIVQFCVRTAEA